jgi:molybdopterin synthase sulfur carrier subunit
MLALPETPRFHRMATVIFTQQLARFTVLPQVRTSATRLREALDCAFDANPALRGYILDDQGHLRANVVVFIDARRCSDTRTLADPLEPESTVHVLQALSGG